MVQQGKQPQKQGLLKFLGLFCLRFVDVCKKVSRLRGALFLYR